MLPVMGVESEYMVLRFSSGEDVDTSDTAAAVMAIARQQLTHLPGDGAGIFLDSGARFYLDVADHPEWCTAECTDPTDVVCQVRAGERHLREILKQVPGAVLLRGNVSYARPSSTCGTHESYSHTCSRRHLRQVLRAHLLTRVIYTGSGGLNPFHPGIVLSLSPRCLHFDRDGSGLRAALGLTGRDEPLAKHPYQRAHIVLGESVSLNLPLWLRLATTSLLVTLTEAGVLTPEVVPSVDSPAAALRVIALDTSLTKPVRSAGSRSTALQIQRAYLDLVERHTDHSSMPDWAPLACARWRAVLDTLEAGANSAVECCEWALKHQVMRQHLGQCDLDWDRVERFNTVVEQAASRLGVAPEAMDDLENHLRAGDRLPNWITTQARRHGFHHAEVQRILELREELCEIDMSFAMDPGGIYDAIEPQITNHVAEITDQRIRHSMKSPPEDTRAAVRGRYIRRLSGDGARYAVSWNAIWDNRNQLHLDLSDPFCRRARWKKSNLRASARQRSIFLERLRQLNTPSRELPGGSLRRAAQARREMLEPQRLGRSVGDLSTARLRDVLERLLQSHTRPHEE
jgi:proteasome accessory factor A